mmetsp:Transcript_51739/g.110005  ORF Transcript_51739/g.110005 Transcript_51739/m.110005 type:complete len:240 (+) Transcript_51739:292-1011(+)
MSSLTGSVDGIIFFHKSSRLLAVGNWNSTRNLRLLMRDLSILDTKTSRDPVVSTIKITTPGNLVISRMTILSRRESVGVPPPPLSLSSEKPSSTSTASINLASWNTFRTALPPPSEGDLLSLCSESSRGKSTTLSGFPSSNPIASAARLRPVPLAPQKSAVVPCLALISLSNPQDPNRIPRAFSRLTISLSEAVTASLVTKSLKPPRGTTRSLNSTICRAPLTCFLQPFRISVCEIIGE